MCRGHHQTEAPVAEALGTILAACKRHKVIAGLHNATSGYALKMASQGWQFVTLASDSRFLAAKAAEEPPPWSRQWRAESSPRTRARSRAPLASA